MDMTLSPKYIRTLLEIRELYQAVRQCRDAFRWFEDKDFPPEHILRIEKEFIPLVQQLTKYLPTFNQVKKELRAFKTIMNEERILWILTERDKKNANVQTDRSE